MSGSLSLSPSPDPQHQTRLLPGGRGESRGGRARTLQPRRQGGRAGRHIEYRKPGVRRKSHAQLPALKHRNPLYLMAPQVCPQLVLSPCCLDAPRGPGFPAEVQQPRAEERQVGDDHLGGSARWRRTAAGPSACLRGVSSGSPGKRFLPPHLLVRNRV